MHYDPRADVCPLPFDVFKSCTVPRPIGWLSTISRDGRANLAPYSQWQNITFDPPIVMFAANQHVDGRRKDTVVNAEETGYFVWNMATYALREAVNQSARDVAFGVEAVVRGHPSARNAVGHRVRSGTESGPRRRVAGGTGGRADNATGAEHGQAIPAARRGVKVLENRASNAR